MQWLKRVLQFELVNRFNTSIYLWGKIFSIKHSESDKTSITLKFFMLKNVEILNIPFLDELDAIWLRNVT